MKTRRMMKTLLARSKWVAGLNAAKSLLRPKQTKPILRTSVAALPSSLAKCWKINMHLKKTP